MRTPEKVSPELKPLHDLRTFEPRGVAVQLAVLCLNLSGRLPSDEQLNLAQQIRRSAISIASNIAEGYARRTGSARRNQRRMCTRWDVLRWMVFLRTAPGGTRAGASDGERMRSVYAPARP